jgi:hypothetical protein
MAVTTITTSGPIADSDALVVAFMRGGITLKQAHEFIADLHVVGSFVYDDGGPPAGAPPFIGQFDMIAALSAQGVTYSRT